MEKAKISLRKMLFYGYHGCLDSEREIGQVFEVDVELIKDFSVAIVSDDLQSTVDYSLVYHIVRELVEGEPFKLIEALGGEIAKKLFKEFALEQITVTVRKPNPPVGGMVGAAEFEITLNKSEQKQ